MFFKHVLVSVSMCEHVQECRSSRAQEVPMMPGEIKILRRGKL
jgi:hypothetical protein